MRIHQTIGRESITTVLNDPVFECSLGFQLSGVHILLISGKQNKKGKAVRIGKKEHQETKGKSEREGTEDRMNSGCAL